MKLENQTEPLPAPIENLIRNMLDTSVDHWRREPYKARLENLKATLDKAIAQFEREKLTRKK
jgi:hypothetical protein